MEKKKKLNLIDFIKMEMKKANLTKIWIGEFGVLAEAYDNYIKTNNPKIKRSHPISRLEGCMQAIRLSKDFKKIGEIRSIHNSNRETLHPFYELIENKK